MTSRISSFLVISATALATLTFSSRIAAEEPKPSREQRDLNKSYFPFTPVKSKEEWDIRKEEVKRRVLVASGLWPMPTKTPLNAVVHGRIERDDYTIDKVYFESLPGHYVCGSLYLPKPLPDKKIPAIINPHGHWPNGRFMVANDAAIKKEIATGAERFENAARSPLQARCAQLARMGCAAFFYDMLGYADSVQFSDASGNVEHRHGPKDKGFVSPEAEHQLVGYFPLQTWNSVRVLDFMESLPYVDKTRIGCTGASGGGTQTMIISGIDERVTAAFPCVMVSTAMQGGCTCENTNHLRIGAGNIDFAALTAPRAIGMTAADDWTKDLETKGFPDLKNLFTMLKIPDRVEAHFNVHFPHNYNHVSRTQMYAFFNKHLKLGLPSPVLERDFTFTAPEDLTVWDDKHPKPSGDKVGTAHEVAVVEWFKQDSAKQLASVLAPKTKEDSAKQREVLGGAWQTLLACKLPGKGESAFALGTKEEKADHLLMRGATNCGKISVDGTFIYPKQWNNTVVVWLSLKGESSIIDANGDLTAPARQLLGEGCSIACPKLYLQGATKTPNAYNDGKRKMDSFFGYAGYHYGYNPSLFAERVHDVLATIAMIRDHEKYRTQKVVLAGVEGAGLIAAAAAALAPSDVTRLVVDTDGFRFANLTDVWDTNFIPGAARYGDIFGILSLCSGTPTTVINEDPKTLGNVIASFRAAGNESALDFVMPEDGKEIEVAARAASEVK